MGIGDWGFADGANDRGPDINADSALIENLLKQ